LPKEGDHIFYFLFLLTGCEDNNQWKEHEMGGQGEKEKKQSQKSLQVLKCVWSSCSTQISQEIFPVILVLHTTQNGLNALSPIRR
jgi:hypothetical protein